ncbi:LytTR family DNA-binding domain-containing protein [Lishizhenia sp.]|uniref:LytTR family DNA-binding domain-containing protein n=1 Tax=Lishizhenia sp. TaxID=2497594 RepID=UPI00299E73EC|nr:LytTR family DNA-binding domain-containing protein [Lishizhenia sp.]MDX1445125.1 LytTR family DNA-binding domain-containing protein [Lishizhenia sp.]
MIIAISGFIGLFLMLFQPFGLQFVEVPYKSVKLLGYGCVTLAILVLNLLLLPLMFPHYFEEKNWTVGKQIVWLNIDVLMIAVGNYFYSVEMHFFPWIGWEGMLIFIGFTVPIGLFPAVIITFLQQNKLLRQHIKSSVAINQQLHSPKKIEVEEVELLEVESGSQNYVFNPSEIVYIETEGNYLNIYHFKDEVLKSTQVRMTLKKMNELIEQTYLFKSHRAFIVNLNCVEQVDGNAQGYTLTLKNTTARVPVSRSFIPAFKEKMEQL